MKKMTFIFLGDEERQFYIVGHGSTVEEGFNDANKFHMESRPDDEPWEKSEIVSVIMVPMEIPLNEIKFNGFGWESDDIEWDLNKWGKDGYPKNNDEKGD